MKTWMIRWSHDGLAILLAFATLCLSPRALAQPPAAPKEAVADKDQRVDLAVKRAVEAKAKKKEGWIPKLSLGVNISLAHSDNVPGVDNGIAFSLGIVINGSLLFLSDGHEWKTELTILHTQTKVPTIEPFIKTADTLDLKSFYTYRFQGKLGIGLFGGLQIITALFPTNLVVGNSTQIVNVNPDNTLEGPPRTLPGNQPENLTGPFSPLIFKQKLGVSAKPYRDKFATLDVKLALVAQEVWARGRVVQDNPETPALELRILQDYVQAGGELSVELSGSLHERVSYSFTAEFMQPFVTSVPTDLAGFQLLNADLSFKVGIKLAKWASLDYVFRALRVPLLVDQWQVTNNLVLNVKADFL